MEAISDLKLAKFGDMVMKTNTYFHKNERDGEAYFTNFGLPISKDRVEEYLKEPLVKIVYDNYFRRPRYGYMDSMGLEHLIHNLNDTSDPWTSAYQVRFSYTYCAIHSETCKGALLFWSLFLCAVSEAFYDNELNLVSDLAAALEFTPDDVKDWITAVKFVLDGNELSEECDLPVHGDKAQKFFLHKMFVLR
jgi:hypothetical protein